MDYFSDQKASEESSLPAMLKDREMMIVENYVAPSEIHGVGLFAGEDIEKDQIIYILDRNVDVVMNQEQIDCIGSEFARFMRVYAFAEINTKEIMISLDNFRFMNHHEFPNSLWTYFYGWAARDIRKGEELTSSIVLESRQASTARENQSMTATR